MACLRAIRLFREAKVLPQTAQGLRSWYFLNRAFEQRNEQNIGGTIAAKWFLSREFMLEYAHAMAGRCVMIQRFVVREVVIFEWP